MSQKSAIWIDKRQAWILKMKGDQEEFEQVDSSIDESKPGGGYRGTTPDQSQGGKADDHVLNRQLGQFQEFFDEIISKVENSEKVVIEGPAETKMALLKRFREQKRLREIELELRNADSMTLNQFKAGARSVLAK